MISRQLRAAAPRSLATVIGLSLGLGLELAMALAPAQAGPYGFDSEEAAYDELYLATPIELQGRIVDEGGAPLFGAQLTLIAWGDNAANHGATVETNMDGSFVLPGQARRAALLRIAYAGYYSEIVPVDLHRPLAEDIVDLGDIELVIRQPGRVRITFAGDLMMGRRFFDKDEDGVWGEPGDLLGLASLTEDTESLFRFVRAVLEADDHTAVNLETPVTNQPITPHPTKSYTFFAYPASLSVLPTVGIDSVSLGNNHVYDFMEAGFVDTISALSATGLSWYGAGFSDTNARANRWQSYVNGVYMSFQGFEDMVGYSYGGDELHIVAKDEPIVKGGALRLTSSSLSEFLDRDAAAYFAVPIMHGGKEYQFLQTDKMRQRFKAAVAQGAGLVVAHHPHVAQGVSVYDAGAGPRYIFGSLGNFVFDQEIFETLRSFLAQVDIDSSAFGYRVARVRLIPYRLDNYVPRLLAGAGLTRMARHLGHLSTGESAPDDGITGATVFAAGGRVVVNASPDGFVTTEIETNRRVPLGANGTSEVIEFWPFTASDSLAGISSPHAPVCSPGRDLLVLGDFEEQDVDDTYHEGDRWRQSSSRYLQNSVVHRGTGAAVILRTSTNQDRASIWLDNRIRITAGRVYTLTGFHKGDNAGVFHVTVRWMDSGGNTIAHDVAYERTPGTYDWSQFTIDASAPPDAKYVKVYFRGYPPATGEARLFLDDLALIDWGDAMDVGVETDTSLKTPNDWGYLRCHAATGHDEVEISLRHRIYEPL